ncbi:MAG: heat shock protein Hsp20 [Bryobacterales bacterium]|nr:heat shock protein Hsp20 [Bryobacterales bacterium]
MADTQQRTDVQQDRGAQQASQESQLSRSPRAGLSRRMQDPFMISPREFFSASPFALMRRMSEEMDRIFGQAGGAFGSERGQSGGSMWSPAIEVAERDGKYVVCAELPGLKPEEVKVELTDDALVIQGERRWQTQEDKGDVHRTERRYGQFYRTIPLPQGINPDEVQANFDNGVLEVTVPAPRQQDSRREIPVKAKSGDASSSGTSGGSSFTGSAATGSETSATPKGASTAKA